MMGLAKASLEASVRYLAKAIGEKGIRVNGISAAQLRRSQQLALRTSTTS